MSFPATPPFGSVPPGAPQVRQGPCFQYVVPAGWQVAEDGSHAVVLVAPDRCAITMMVGNAGMPSFYNPAQFVYEKLSALRPEHLQLGPGRPAPPIAGFANAVEFDYVYRVGGVPCRGVAVCHVAPAYDTCTMVMTAAAAQESQWPGYASWLPQVPRQVAASSGAAFGARGVMQQSLDISVREGEAQREYRDWSQRQWAEVVQDRNASVDRNTFEARQNLGAVQTYSNPYGYPPVELSTQYTHYWMNRHGRIVGTNDPSENPNTGSTDEWSRMGVAGR